MILGLLIGALILAIIRFTNYIVAKKHFSYISLVLMIIALALMVKELILKINVNIIELIVIYLLNVLTYVYDIILERNNNVRTHVIKTQLKNDSSDFYLMLNKKGKIIDYSKSITNLTHLNKKQIIKQDGLEFMIKHFNIIKLNDKVFDQADKLAFVNGMRSTFDKRTPTVFNFDTSNQGNVARYNGLINPVYDKKNYLGVMILIYQDKMSIITNVKEALENVTDMLSKHKNVTNILMTLSEGVALYYDYQERTYIATQAFQDYVNVDKQTYSFQELLELIPLADQELYFDQSATINTKAVTRIKYHLNLKGTEFEAIEDSIYLSNDTAELASIIHIVSKSGSNINENIMSTKETQDKLAELVDQPISSMLKETIEMLDKALVIKDHEE